MKVLTLPKGNRAPNSMCIAMEASPASQTIETLSTSSNHPSPPQLIAVFLGCKRVTLDEVSGDMSQFESSLSRAGCWLDSPPPHHLNIGFVLHDLPKQSNEAE